MATYESHTFAAAGKGCSQELHWRSQENPGHPAVPRLQVLPGRVSAEALAGPLQVPARPVGPRLAPPMERTEYLKGHKISRPFRDSAHMHTCTHAHANKQTSKQASIRVSHKSRSTRAIQQHQRHSTWLSRGLRQRTQQGGANGIHVSCSPQKWAPKRRTLPREWETHRLLHAAESARSLLLPRGYLGLHTA